MNLRIGDKQSSLLRIVQRRKPRSCLDESMPSISSLTPPSISHASVRKTV
jgi:hypothetical protein